MEGDLPLLHAATTTNEHTGDVGELHIGNYFIRVLARTSGLDEVADVLGGV